MQKTTNRHPSLDEALAGESSKGLTQREMLPERLERYAKAHAYTLDMRNYIMRNHSDIDCFRRLASNLGHCGSYLLFRDYFTVGEVRLKKANFCKKHLLCPLCAIRRGAKHLRNYLDRYTTVLEGNPALRPYLVTLTVKDGDNLQERFNHLRNCVTAYHKRRHIDRALCEAKHADGAVWSYEVKRGKRSGLWHPHMHAIWLCETAPNAETLSKQWHTLTRDSFIVDVRPVVQADPVSGFLEVFKYAVKFSDQSLSDTWHCFQTLSGRRLLGSFGSLYGVPEPDELADEMLDDLPYIDLLFVYEQGAYRPCKLWSMAS